MFIGLRPGMSANPQDRLCGLPPIRVSYEQGSLYNQTPTFLQAACCLSTQFTTNISTIEIYVALITKAAKVATLTVFACPLMMMGGGGRGRTTPSRINLFNIL